MPPDVLRARQLRQAMSYPEVLLWQRLRGSPMGVRFRRQHPGGSDYCVDFHCPSARLAIEVDGEAHSLLDSPERDAHLRSLGLNVVHIPAVDVLRDADGTAAAIVALAATPLHHPASPDGFPPHTGEDQR